MPTQTTKANLLFPDGAKVSVKTTSDSVYVDLGAIEQDINTSLTYTENQITTANAGKTAKQIKDMKIEGSFNLID